MLSTAPSIESWRIRQLIVPFEQPLRTASGVMQAAPIVLFDVRTSSGVVGHSYLFCYTPTVLRAVASLAVSVTELTIGHSIAPVQRISELRSMFKLLGTAGLLDMVLSGIDMALWDAWGKTLAKPLSDLFGADAENRARIPVYASYGMENAEQTRRNVDHALSAGHQHVKIKIGYSTLKEDESVVDAALTLMDGKASLLIDYNQSLSVAEALVRCRHLDSYGLTWIEEPTNFDDLEGHARISEYVTTPIQIGENLWGPSQISASLDARASDLMMPDLGKVGGVTGWQQAVAICGAKRVPVSNHFYQELSAHLMLVTPGAHLLEYFKMADPILENPLEVKDGHAIVSDRPGSGLAWREDQVERYLQ
ncbi:MULTISPECIES: enolase C-terminal domain-like protein [Rhizobium/Agrobacterium group]|uniref:enolase C-terminal domain-like protein n=1 Tax=Rhizobium/Agrobacterium group TaxID=227290 RepID=UPI0019D5D299|nr:enolase C-terminal domain-like protein [Rhizobium rhizogenes]